MLDAKSYCHAGKFNTLRVIINCWVLGLLALLVMPVEAAPDISLGAVSGTPGTTVNVPINLTNDGTAVTLQIDLQFDPTYLTAGTVVAGSAVGSHGFATSSPSFGIVRIVISPTSSNSVISSGTLATVPITISPAIPAGQTITLTNIVISDTAATAITPTSTSGGGPTVVIITDSTPPVVTAPADIVIEATAIQSIVTLGAATVTDNIDTGLVAIPSPSGSFPLGTTTVTWTATDSAGNVGTDTQLVTVQDTTPPVLIIPANINQTTTSTPPIAISIGLATATDIFTPVTLTNDAPALFPAGITSVTWTATDANNNIATAVQVITLTYATNTPPVVTNPGNQSGVEGAVVTLNVVATDAENNPLAYTATGLPAGLSINNTTGVISGTYSSGGAGSSPYAVVITVSDSLLSTSISFNWIITAPVPPGNVMYGTPETDHFNGTEGNDTMIGGAGKDYYNGNGGDDTFIEEGNGDIYNNYNGGPGYDRVIGGSGDDTFRLAYFYNGIELQTVEEIDGKGGTNRINGANFNTTIDLRNTLLKNIETTYQMGNADWNKFWGTAANETIIGGPGINYLHGEGGDDTFPIPPDQGNWSLFDGGPGYDRITGSATNNVLRLNVFSMNTTLYPPYGQYVEEIDGVGGTNTIVGTSGEDYIDLSSTTLINIQPNYDMGAGDDTLIATDADETLIGGTGNDILQGRGGNDTYIINLGDGHDTITDTAGNDRILFGAGITSADITVERNGNSLSIGYSPTEWITITDWYLGLKIETIEFSDGSTMTAAEIEGLAL